MKLCPQGYIKETRYMDSGHERYSDRHLLLKREAVLFESYKEHNGQ
jgi:hypothetical protein